MQSMTGCGTSRGRIGQSNFTVEIRSVNHRYCETNIRLPGRLSLLEQEIAGLIRRRFVRGRFDLFIKEEWADREAVEIELAERCYSLLRRVQRKLKLDGAISLSHLLQFWDLSLKQSPPEMEGHVPLRKGLLKTIDRALRTLQRMRLREGSALKRWFRTSLRRLLSLMRTLEIEVKSQEEEAISQSKEEGSEESAGLARKGDVTEEVIRLKSHLRQFEKTLNGAGERGRKLDFLAQEMVREINTLGSKVLGVQAIHHVIDFKSELEKIREQIQNVE